MEEVKESGATGAFKGYSMKKKQETLAEDSGMRMDTMGGDNSDELADDYGKQQQYRDDYDSEGSGQNQDKVSVNLDDLEDEPEEDSDEAVDLGRGRDLSSLRYSNSGEPTGSESTSSQGLKAENLFAVGTSNDKGLADMETGSEVYMSELLVSIKHFR